MNKSNSEATTKKILFQLPKRHIAAKSVRTIFQHNMALRDKGRIRIDDHFAYIEEQ
jgi:hypothetical protein